MANSLGRRLARWIQLAVLASIAGCGGRDLRLEAVVDFGRVVGSESHEHVVHLENTTGGAWRVGEPKTSCVCVTATATPQEVVPEQSVSLRVKLDAPPEGEVAHTVHVPVLAKDGKQVGIIVVGVQGVAMGPPWAGPRMHVLDSPSEAKVIGLEFSLPTPEGGLAALSSMPDVAVEVVHSLGGVVPDVSVSFRAPVVDGGRVVWGGELHVPTVNTGYSGLIVLRGQHALASAAFPPIRVEWAPVRTGDIDLTVRKHADVLLPFLAGADVVTGSVAGPIVPTAEARGMRLKSGERGGDAEFLVKRSSGVCRVRVKVIQ